MSDWGPIFVAVVLFILLTPGLLIQVPGRSRCIEFGNFQTSGLSILVHSIIYFAVLCILLLAIDIEVDMKNNKEQDEEQSIENCMHENGGRTGLHVHKINGVMLSWDLQQQTR
ncbi:hypothetical protein V6N13_127235 [Hibiscus sabdariffa]|uniref:Transmembrane protein n=1 Tax=Hibiscus sabdariffa TaxID=183260 RepID=A0ABR2RD35_9ROSI